MKYYCDYCTSGYFDFLGDIFLTHDSPSVRKTHNQGWKHKSCVRSYYQQFEQDLSQGLIDRQLGIQFCNLRPRRIPGSATYE